MAGRRVIDSASMPRHRNPIPAAVVIGNFIFPSVISGHNPNGETSDDPAEQIRQAFVNMETVVREAGGTTRSIAKIVIYLKDFSHRELVNHEWLKMFPDDHDRAARHVMKADIQGKAIIQMDVIAALDK